MKPHATSFLVVLAILALANCSSVVSPDDVEIRIRNASEYDFESVLVQFPGQTEEYGPVPSGESTDYRKVDRAYSYAYHEVVAAGKTLLIQPIDYLGEELLEPGRYTYELSVRSDPWRLSFDFIEE